MKNNLEIEFKVLVNENSFQRLLSRYSHAVTINQKNTYFDTTRSDLQRQKIVVRIREINGSCEFTMKVPNEKGLHEYSIEVIDSTSSSLEGKEIRNLLIQFGIIEPLIIVGTLHTERHLINDLNGELCLDKNTYSTGVDYEIEYESNGNPDQALSRFKQILTQENIKYIPNEYSKYARCMGLSNEKIEKES